MAEVSQKESITVLYYEFGPRFTKIQKEEVHNATILFDFLTNKEMESIESITSISIIVIENESQSGKRAIGTNARLRAE